MPFKFNPFTGKLDEFGPVLTGTGTVSAAADGTEESPGIAFASDLDTGIYRPDADQLAISTNGTQRLLIEADGDINIDSGGVFYDATNNRLGIGTSNPLRLFQVEGTGGQLAVIQATAGNSILRVDAQPTAGAEAYLWCRASTTGLGSVQFGTDVDGDVGKITYDFSDNNLQFRVNADERMRIDSSGRLLVGTSSALSVDSEASLGAFDTSGIQLSGTNSPSSIGLFNYSNSTFNDRPNQLTFARSRGAEFTQTLVGSGDALGAISFQGSDGAKFVRAAAIRAEVDGTPGTDDMPGRLVFSTTADGASSPTERMRIGQSGAIQAFSTNNSHSFRSNRTLSTEQIILVRNNASSVSDGTTVFQVMADGDVENTNNSYTGISDIKLKENIVDANSQWNDLKAFQVRNYNFKAETGYSTHTQIGLIAQEVELVSPGLVGESIDEETGEFTKSVNYSVLYMKAVKALQEAMERIEMLEAKVNALEGN